LVRCGRPQALPISGAPVELPTLRLQDDGSLLRSIRGGGALSDCVAYAPHCRAEEGGGGGCLLTGGGARCGEEVCCTVRAVDRKGVPRQQGGDRFEVRVWVVGGGGAERNGGLRLLPPGAGAPRQCRVQDQHDGRYRVSFTPAYPGPHQLWIRHHGCGPSLLSSLSAAAAAARLLGVLSVL
jgi:hypothetical protein